MADTLAQVQKDVRFWQRLLTFAGYKPGKVDGVNGRKTKAAAQEWQNDAKRIKAEIG
ncbi:MAG: peptidoglycan-binding protein, partial [Akkermansia sp.]|nr:peptidoglycan-binding protein [Akkermansia sp.]